VVGGIGQAVLEPFDRDLAGAEGGVLDLGGRSIPVDPLGLLPPEPVRILDRAGVHLVVLGLVDEGALFPLRRNSVDLLRHRSLQLRRLNMPRYGPFLMVRSCGPRHYATVAGRATSRDIFDFGRRIAAAAARVPRGTGGRPSRREPDGAPARAYNADHRNAG